MTLTVKTCAWGVRGQKKNTTKFKGEFSYSGDTPDDCRQSVVAFILSFTYKLVHVSKVL